MKFMCKRTRCFSGLTLIEIVIFLGLMVGGAFAVLHLMLEEVRMTAIIGEMPRRDAVQNAIRTVLDFHIESTSKRPKQFCNKKWWLRKWTLARSVWPDSSTTIKLVRNANDLAEFGSLAPEQVRLRCIKESFFLTESMPQNSERIYFCAFVLPTDNGRVGSHCPRRCGALVEVHIGLEDVESGRPMFCSELPVPTASAFIHYVTHWPTSVRLTDRSKYQLSSFLKVL